MCAQLKWEGKDIETIYKNVLVCVCEISMCDRCVRVQKSAEDQGRECAPVA